MNNEKLRLEENRKAWSISFNAFSPKAILSQISQVLRRISDGAPERRRFVSSRCTYIGERLRRLEDEVPREGQRGMVLAGLLRGRVRHQVHGTLLPLLLLDGFDVPVSTHCGRLLENTAGLGLAGLQLHKGLLMQLKAIRSTFFSKII